MVAEAKYQQRNSWNQVLAGASHIPLPQVRRPEEGRRHTDARTSANLPPPITMHLDHQGPPVTYSEAASRPPQRVITSPDELEMGDVQIKTGAHEREKGGHSSYPQLDQENRNRNEQATLRKEKECELRRVCQHEARRKLVKEGAWQQEEYNHEWRASGACPDPITNPLGWCEYEWSKKDKYESPTWAGDLWSAIPMDHQQLATRMVCLWGLVKAYQWTQQNVYICLLAPTF